MKRVRQVLDPLLRRVRWDSEFWRRALLAGATHGPEAFVRYSPPMFGLIFGALLPRQRAVVDQTLVRLDASTPRWRRSVEVARIFANYGSCLADSVLLGTERGYRPLVHLEQAKREFRKCAALGRGVILATAHTAGWDVAGSKLASAQQGEVVVVMERERDERARELHDAVRERTGVRVLHAGDDPLAALPLLKHLRRDGGVVAMKFDRTVPGMRCIDVTFLGERWKVPAGIFTLAAVSGAPILPMLTRRLGFLEYEFVTNDPFTVSRRADAAELGAAAQRLATHLENFARENPDHWFRFSDDPT